MAERSRWAPGAAALADAARAVSTVVFDGRSSDEALRAYDESSQRAAVRAIALGTFRWYLRLAPAIDRLLSRPDGVANEIRALLAVSAHQIEYSRNAPQATAHAAVDATRILRQGRASGLVNAVLRRFVAEKATLLGQVDRKLSGRTAHPQWLVKLLEEAWPNAAETILTANNEHPPLVLRIDLSRKTRELYLSELAAADIAATAIDWAPAAVRLERPIAVAQLPGFSEGIVSVQDAGAQLAAKLLDVRPGMRVLDACAAPGGKTGHLLESTPDQELVAVDVDESRVALIRQNLERLRRHATVEIADIREPLGVREALRSNSRGCPVLVDGGHPSSSGYKAAATCFGHCLLRGDPGADPPVYVQHAGPRWPAGLLHVLSLARRERGSGGPIAGDRVVRPRCGHASRGCAAAWGTGQKIRDTAHFRRSGGHRRLLLCLCRKDNGRRNLNSREGSQLSC